MIKHLRIDNRLIHGQVAVTWMNSIGADKIIVITISGRGDKDCAAIARYRGEDISE